MQSFRTRLSNFQFVIFVTVLLIVSIFGARPLAAQVPQLVKDINTTQDVGSSNASQFVQVGDTTFFTAQVPGEGIQLWKTDGTVSGTTLVTNRYFGSVSGMTSSNGRLFFVTGDSAFSVSYIGGTFATFVGSSTFSSADTSASELWTSDGTDEGTVKLKDALYSGNMYINGNPVLPVDVNGTLFFVSDDGAGGIALWKTDGTAAGTVMVKSFGGTSPFNSPVSLTAANGKLFFFSYGFGTSFGGALWTSDGTADGTVVVKQLSDGLSNCATSNLTNVNGTLFFTGCGATLLGGSTPAVTLWKSDGTAEGTVELTDIVASGINGTPQEFTNVNGTLLFRIMYPASGFAYTTELWKSDGTVEGTAAVTSLCADSCDSSSSYLTNVNGALFYAAQGGLWKSDGTSAGTVEVASDISPTDLASLNGRLFFAATDASSGRELWESDGTPGGTAMVKDVCPGVCSSLIQPRNLLLSGAPAAPSSTTNGSSFSSSSYLLVTPSLPVNRILFVSNGRVFFAGCEPVHGCEPWSSDGTAGGTSLLKNIVVNTASQILRAADLNGTLMFPAFDGVATKLWKSDGTSNGTTSVKEVLTAFVSQSGVAGGKLFFVGFDNEHGYELWKTDGTDAGTSMVKDINPGPAASMSSLMAAENDTLFFVANDGTNGYSLWKSDSTEAGTVMVKKIDAAASGSLTVSSLIDVNGTVYFAASDGIGGTALWKSDGTEAGTVQLVDLLPTSSDLCGGTSCVTFTGPSTLVNVNGTVFFNSSSRGLWKSDGTTEGTTPVAPGIALGSTANLIAVNGNLFFTTSGFTNNTFTGALWKTDGTEAGTVEVKDFTATSTPSPIVLSILSRTPTYLTSVNGMLFFTAPDGENGSALWKSDGTTEGTIVVKDISASGLAGVNGALYFAANDADGTELWKSDGTSEGTARVADTNPGANGSFPQVLGTAHGRMFFNANDGTHGMELWALTVAPTTVALGSSINPVVVGRSVTITATVTSMVTGTFTGTVDFLDGATLLGTAAVNGNGVATITTTSLTAGTHAITAVYTGDPNFPDGTTPSAVSLVVLAVPPDYALVATPTTATIRAGQSATFAITATADQYFNGTITFSCGTLPVGVTCSFSHPTVNPTSASPAQTTLTVSTTSRNAALMTPLSPVNQGRGIVLWASMSGIGVFGVLLVGGTSKRKRIGLLSVALILLAFGLTACGGGGSVQKNPNGTPIGSSTVQVTATATSGTTGGNTAAHNLAITITVQ